MHWSTPLKQEWLIRYRNPLLERMGREFFRSVPRVPGVYRFYGPHAGEAEALLYVGKAKNLRDRLASYRRATPDTVSRKVLWMLAHVRRIELETCASERAALLRENRLLRALRPPYNVLNTSPENYAFIALLETPKGARFRIMCEEIRMDSGTNPRERFFGAFRSRAAVREAYGALLRLLWMSTYSLGGARRERARRYEIPGALLRYKPPTPYTLPHALPAGWDRKIASFLSGRSRGLLGVLTMALLDENSIPPFLYPRVQEDLGTLQEFFRSHCARNRRLCRHFGRDGSLIAQDEIDDWNVLYRG